MAKNVAKAGNLSKRSNKLSNISSPLRFGALSRAGRKFFSRGTNDNTEHPARNAAVWREISGLKADFLT
jgi:hypothetical protein